MGFGRYSGTPMYAPAQDAYHFVTVERVDPSDPKKRVEFIDIKRWKGPSSAAIKKYARWAYPESEGYRLRFGRVFWITR